MNATVASTVPSFVRRWRLPSSFLVEVTNRLTGYTTLLLLTASLCAGCAYIPRGTTEEVIMPGHDEEDSVRRWFEEWTVATDSGDLARAHSLVADDAVFLVPGFGRMDPKDFIEGASSSPEKLEQYEFSGGAEVEEIRVSGSLAYILTKSDFAITDKASGEETKYSGHSLSVLEKGPSGTWLLIRDANTVLPLGQE